MLSSHHMQILFRYNLNILWAQIYQICKKLIETQVTFKHFIDNRLRAFQKHVLLLTIFVEKIIKNKLCSIAIWIIIITTIQLNTNFNFRYVFSFMIRACFLREVAKLCARLWLHADAHPNATHSSKQSRAKQSNSLHVQWCNARLKAAGKNDEKKQGRHQSRNVLYGATYRRVLDAYRTLASNPIEKHLCLCSHHSFAVIGAEQDWCGIAAWHATVRRLLSEKLAMSDPRDFRRR